MKLVTATKHGGSISIPLTGLVKEGEQYIVTKKGKQIIVVPAKDVIKEEEGEQV